MGDMLRMTEEQYQEYLKRNHPDGSPRVGAIGAVGLVGPGAIMQITPNKYRAQKTGEHASKKEAKRSLALHLMQEAGAIRNLREQVAYVLIPKQEGERGVKYIADFVYEEWATDGWREVVEDAKSPPTRANRAYIIKRKLLLWVHGIRVRET